MKDQRKYRRVSSEGLGIQCKVHLSTDVQLVNISSSGASIILTKPLNMGQEYSLHVKREDSYMVIEGVVIWERLVDSRKNEGGEITPVYRAGMKFKNVLTDQGAELIDFIDRHFVPSELKARLRGIRVDITGDQLDTIKDFHQTDRILKISLGGMLLTTDARMVEGDSCWMELHLGDGKTPVSFLGKIVSSSLNNGEDAKSYRTALEIVEISDQDRSVLREFIDSLESES
jgi:hypothetical protein